MFDKTLYKLINQRNLSFQEAKSSMLEIMSGNVSNVKLASWLTALKIKEETPDEYAGFAEAVIECADKIILNDKNAVDIVGTGGDGENTINISTAASLVASASGVTIAKHGNRAVSSKCGSSNVLEELGVNIDISLENVKRCIDTIGLGFIYAPKAHKAFKYARDVRNELKIRTVFNVIGPLCNPAEVKRIVLGVYDRDLCPYIAETLLKLNYDRAMIVHGLDGLDEISIAAGTMIFELEAGKIKEYEFEPRNYGFKPASLNDIKGGAPKENAEILCNLLKNKNDGPIKDVVVLNSAAAIIVGGRANLWEDAIQMALNSINSGDAFNKLKQLISLTNSFEKE